MEKCTCSSNRILHIYGKTSDCFNMQYKDIEYESYPPLDINISKDGDSIEFDLCLDCGKIIGNFPIPDEKIIKYMKDE